MKQVIKQSYFISGLALLFLLPQISAAAGTGIKFKLPNFLNFDSIESLVIGILNVLVVIAIPIIVLRIIYSGFLYVTAGGDTTKLEQARLSLTYSIIGGILVLGAVAFSQVIANVVKSFTP